MPITGEVSERNDSSEYDNSDRSMMDYRNRDRQRVVLTKEELEDLNEDLRKSNVRPIDMKMLGRITVDEANLLRQKSK